jgi:hypothetical protein
MNKNIPFIDLEKARVRAVTSTREMHISFSSRVSARARLLALARRSNSLPVTRALATHLNKTTVILKLVKSAKIADIAKTSPY